MSVRAFIVIEAKDITAANALAASTFDLGGEGNRTFTVGLVPINSPIGTTPTHYITSSEIQDEKFPLLAQFQPQFTGSYFEQYSLLQAPNRPWEYVASVGLQRPAVKQP